MGVYFAPYVDIAVSTDIYASGDALGVKSSFPNIPEHGVITAVNVIDRDKEIVNLDIVFFTNAIAGTADNAAFDPTDAELSTSLGSILVSTWKSFNDNAQGVATSTGLPYWAPTGVLFFQCVTRGTPTYTAVTDVLVSVSIVY